MPTADELLSAATVTALAGCLERAGATADATRRSASALGGLALGARAAVVRDALLADLPDGWPPFAAVLRTALADPGFTGWMVWPVADAVAVRGLEVFEPGLEMLRLLTPRLTAEFAVRPFLRADQPRALRVLAGWTGDPDEHVRRLVSEGSRPRLPWAARLPSLVADPAPAIPLLDALYRDEAEYVRRSVANHLNDISRDHPDTAVAVAARWMADPADTTERVVRHGLRTLVKQGHPGALTVLGHAPDLPVVVEGPHVLTALVRMGGHLEFTYAVTNAHDGPASVVVDYVVHHVKADGRRTPKVFKLVTRRLAPGETWRGTRRHAFRPLTTRRYHPGEHAVAIQVNGRPHGEAAFTLEV